MIRFSDTFCSDNNVVNLVIKEVEMSQTGYAISAKIGNLFTVERQN